MDGICVHLFVAYTSVPDFIYAEILDKNLNIIERERDGIDNQWLGSSISAVPNSPDVNGTIIVCNHNTIYLT